MEQFIYYLLKILCFCNNEKCWMWWLQHTCNQKILERYSLQRPLIELSLNTRNMPNMKLLLAYLYLVICSVNLTKHPESLLLGLILPVMCTLLWLSRVKGVKESYEIPPNCDILLTSPESQRYAIFHRNTPEQYFLWKSQKYDHSPDGAKAYKC